MYTCLLALFILDQDLQSVHLLSEALHDAAACYYYPDGAHSGLTKLNLIIENCYSGLRKMGHVGKHASVQMDDVDMRTPAQISHATPMTIVAKAVKMFV